MLVIAKTLTNVELLGHAQQVRHQTLSKSKYMCNVINTCNSINTHQRNKTI